jgi:hypothetical protein
VNIQFGTGVLFGLPNAGNLATNPTPYKFPVLQEASVEFKADLKKLFGTSQFPVAKARGKIDVSCKAKIAAFNPDFMNQMYFGQASAPGVTQMNVEEVHPIPATPFQVTVTNAVHFVTDYGVTFQATGVPLTKVPSAPTTGQYSVNSGTGIYTFAAADTLLGVLISYSSTDATAGETITLKNQLMGFAPEFRAFLFSAFRTKRLGIELYSCTLGQLTIPTKQEDFWMADITFDASVDSSDTLGQIYADVA